MNIEMRRVGGFLASMAWVAVKSFVGTVFVLTAAGIVLAVLSFYFLRGHHWAFGVIAVVIALIESVTTGFILGAKRAMILAVAHGLGSLRLGGAFVRMIFERMLSVKEGKEFGERGGRIAQGLEHLPLAQTEELLNGAVRDLAGQPEKVGWLRRKIQARFFNAVRKYTLGRFREEGARHGGVDLVKVKAELEQTVDDAIVRKIRSGLRIWTVLVIIGLPSVVAVQTVIVLLLLHWKG